MCISKTQSSLSDDGKRLGRPEGFEITVRELAVNAGAGFVVVLTGKASRGWVAGNNAMLRALPERYPNTTVLDWEVLSQGCPGNCFYNDGIHLPPDGQNYYTGLITRLLGLG